MWPSVDSDKPNTQIGEPQPRGHAPVWQG
jgi:hypothetical protein